MQVCTKDWWTTRRVYLKLLDLRGWQLGGDPLLSGGCQGVGQLVAAFSCLAGQVRVEVEEARHIQVECLGLECSCRDAELEIQYWKFQCLILLGVLSGETGGRDCFQ